jgi:hypothetical protein
MSEEIPMANPPLSTEEQSVVARLNQADFQTIDATILTQASDRWRKVARVVGATADALQIQYPGLAYVFYTQRISQLVGDGRLVSKGNLSYMRFSEVRYSHPQVQ